MAESRPPCFVRGGFDDESGIAFVEFTSGGVFSYHNFSHEQWDDWVNSWPRGTYFNHTYRNSAVEYHRQPGWPSGIDNDF